MRAAALALALAVAAGLSGCRTPAARGPGAGAPAVALVIDRTADGTGGVVRVDDRRLIDVPAHGTIDLDRVAPALDLDSVVVEAIGRPGAVRVERCALLDDAQAFGRGWILGREVELVTAGGAEVRGTVVEVDEVAVLAFDDAERELPLSAVSAARPIGAAPPAVGARVMVDTGDGPQPGVVEGIELRSLAVHDAAGVRHAIRGDAIARLRVPELPAAPTLRCRVRAAHPGRQPVRLAYRYADRGWDAAYQVAPVDDATTSITLAPRYTLHLGALRGLGAAVLDVTVRQLRAPDDGGPATPVEVWHGPVALAADAGDVTVLGAPSTRAAQVRRVYHGAAPDPGDAHDRGWGRESTAEVWRELAFVRAASDLAGSLRIGVVDGGVTRWIDAALPDALPGSKLVRVPLAVDPALVGYRDRLVHEEDGLADEVRFSVANRGDAPVEVILEEPLRPWARPAVRFAAPAVGVLAATVWQLEVEVAPGAIARAAVLLQYPEPEP